MLLNLKNIIVCSPPFCRGAEPPTKFSKRGLDRTLTFREGKGVGEKEASDLFEEGDGGAGAIFMYKIN